MQTLWNWLGYKTEEAKPAETKTTSNDNIAKTEDFVMIASASDNTEQKTTKHKSKRTKEAAPTIEKEKPKRELPETQIVNGIKFNRDALEDKATSELFNNLKRQQTERKQYEKLGSTWPSSNLHNPKTAYQHTKKGAQQH